MRSVRSFLGLLAGLLLFDVLVNLPDFSSAHAMGALFVPSIDLLLVAAALLGVAQVAGRSRTPLRMAVCGLLVLLLCLETAVRFGPAVALHLFGDGSWVLAAASGALSVAVVAAAACLAWLASGLLLRGFSLVIVRSGFVAVIALFAVVQVLAGHRIFGPSEIPRLFHEAFSAVR
jgi:hypothetical protein